MGFSPAAGGHNAMIKTPSFLCQEGAVQENWRGVWTNLAGIGFQSHFLTKRLTTRVGFEPTHAEHNGLAVHRLNHSATSSQHGAMLLPHRLRQVLHRFAKGWTRLVSAQMSNSSARSCGKSRAAGSARPRHLLRWTPRVRRLLCPAGEPAGCDRAELSREEP